MRVERSFSFPFSGCHVRTSEPGAKCQHTHTQSVTQVVDVATSTTAARADAEAPKHRKTTRESLACTMHLRPTAPYTTHRLEPWSSGETTRERESEGASSGSRSDGLVVVVLLLLLRSPDSDPDATSTPNRRVLPPPAARAGAETETDAALPATAWLPIPRTLQGPPLVSLAP